uniref:RNA-directed DNA polymerase n=1 Tax=Strongyloides stercoralis TaxID=6248 RepID=A0A0K0E5U1_STRER
MTNHLGEDERVSKLIECIPKLWMDQISRKVLLKSELDMFSGDLILQYVEEIANLEINSEPSSVLVSKLFNVKFDYKSDAACCRLLNDLEEAACSIISESSQEELVRLFFVQLIPVRLKKELCTEPALPSYEKISSFARLQDAQFKHTSYFKKDDNIIVKHDHEKKDVATKDRSKKEWQSTLTDRDTKTIKKEITFHQNISTIDNSATSFASTNCTFGHELITEIFGLDSCAQICTITKDVFEKLSETTKNSLTTTDNQVVIKGVHNSISYSMGYIDTIISIHDYKLNKVPIRVYVDPLSSMCLLSCNFMKHHHINPMESVSSRPPSDNHFLGITMGDNCESIKTFLLEEQSKILIDPDYEPGNKITVHFEVHSSYKPRRYPPIAIPDDIADQVKQILDADVKKNWIRKVVTGEVIQNMNQCVIAKREGKPPRLCYSCIHVNRFIKPIDMPTLPNIKQLLLESNIQTLSIWDINAAFNRLNLSDECKQYCYINTPYGVYQSNVLVFGLKCAPALYYKTIKKIMEGLESYVIIYMDDLLNIAPLDIHQSINLEILSRLRNFNFKLSKDKCMVNVSRVSFLGIDIDTTRGLLLPKHKMDAMLEIKTPKTAKELKAALAKFQYYAQFIPSYSILVDNLHSFTTKKGVIDDIIREQFHALKHGISKSIALQTIQSNCKGITIIVDASDHAFAYLMLCEYEHGSCPFSLGGRILKKYEKNYSLHLKLLLALQEALQCNSTICSAFQVTCCSKLKGLQHIVAEVPIVVRNTSQRILSKLIPYDVHFRVIDTDKHIISMMIEANYDTRTSIDELIVFSQQIAEPFQHLKIDIDDLKHSYKSDKDIEILLDIKTNGWSEIKQKKLDPVFRDHSKTFIIEKDLIFMDGKVVIPKSMSNQVVDQLHENHQSADAMLKIARKFFLFSGMYSKIKNTYDSCNLCITNRRNKRLAVHSWPPSEHVRERYHADVGEFEKKKFLGVYDTFSGYIMSFPLKSLSSNELIAKYIELFNYYGKPLLLVSDNALAFASEHTLAFLQSHNVCAMFSVPTVSISNGYAERCIGLIKSQLKKELSRSKSFNEALQHSQLVLNSRLTHGARSATEIFFGYDESIENILSKYATSPCPMNISCKFKKNRKEDIWYDGTVIERISPSLYKIESENKYWVRKHDHINFLSPEGKLVKNPEALTTEVNAHNIIDSNNSELHADFSDTLEKIDLIKLMQREDIYPRSIQRPNRARKRSMSPRKSNDFEIPGLYELKSQKEVEDFVKLHGIKLIGSSDGSCDKGKGFGYVINLNGKSIIKKSVKCGNNSSAQFLELVGAVQCLKEMVRHNNTQELKNRKALILLDSSYAARALSEDLKIWTRNNFLKTDGSKLVHERFIREARNLLKKIDLFVCKVPGHKDVELNIIADKLAREGAAKPLNKVISFSAM